MDYLERCETCGELVWEWEIKVDETDKTYCESPTCGE